MDENREYKRYQPDSKTGLTAQQVEERVAAGLVNGKTEVPTKSIKEIVRSNVMTLFNLINVILAVLVLSVGSYKNVLFMGVILCNTAIGIFQEIRAKRTIDRLTLISAPKAKVLRNGERKEISVEELVLDDVMILEAGNQICADSIVLNGDCEVNESLITGESDLIPKTAGDELLSGSFISAGRTFARVEHIGEANYAAKITKGAKYVKKNNSEIMRSINSIIKFIGFVIIPLGLILFVKQLFIIEQPFDVGIVNTVAAVIGMIPEGLVLLTSVVLAVSVIRLAQHKTLVQEMYCIETLARVDVLCLDKTGTITEGRMKLEEVIPLGEMTPEQANVILAELVEALSDNNPTFLSIAQHVEGMPTGWNVEQICPFSSAKKWSGASFSGHGTYVFGAAEFILQDRERNADVLAQVERYSAEGNRVLLLARSEEPFRGKELPGGVQPLALLLIADVIRENAQETLQYFAEQGVALKIISGDNAATVANVAQRAGLQDADRWVDASTLQTEKELAEAAEKYTVFGRVTPQQKLSLVKALKEQKHTVAMTGDGVNDVLALKEADCSIAMAAGSDAARHVSQLVLLDSNFASMPKIVAEGRRTINNIQRSATLYLVKTLYASALALIFVFLPYAYPFQPIQLTLINAVTIGIPSFFLALEPNNARIEGSFIYNVIRKAIPGAVIVVFAVLAAVLFGGYSGLTAEQISTVAVMGTAAASFSVLYRVCKPFQLWRGVLFGAMLGIFLVGFFFFFDLFSFVLPNLTMMLVALPIILLCYPIMKLVLRLVNRVLHQRGISS